MKRHVLVALAALIPLATPSRAEDGGFRAGAAMSNITPLMGVPLDGTIMQIGPAKHVHDELWARCLAFDDGQSRLALVVVDCTMVSREVFDAAKRQIELETGIPPDRVCISATHSHSTPRALVGLVDDRLHRGYLDFLANRVADGVRRAVNNLAPAEIGWGGFEEPRFVHNRRWFIDPALWATNANPFGDTGERVKMNPGREGLAKPAGPVDPECFVVSVRHRDGRPIAALGAYGLHYIGGVPGGTVSADYFGVFAKRLRENLGAADLDPPFVGLMANGTSGDINAVDYSAPAERFPPYERMNFVGAELARQAAEAIGRFEHRHAGVTLAAASAELDLAVRKPDAKRLEWARKTAAPPGETKRLTRPQVYARETLMLAEYPDRVSLPLRAFRVGGLAIAQSPCETFAETGLAIKAASPFPKATFTIELANGFYGYLPPPGHFDWGGYETWPARSSLLEETAEAKIRAKLIELIGQTAAPK